MLHKIRAQMYLANENPLKDEVEIDKTLVGGKNKNRHKDKKVPHSQERSHKAPVAGMIQRGGLINAKATNDTTAHTLSALIRKLIHPKTVMLYG